MGEAVGLLSITALCSLRVMMLRASSLVVSSSLLREMVLRSVWDSSVVSGA